VESWDPAGGDVTFVKNEYYWQEGKPYLDKLVYKVISDSNQVLNQLNAGEINASKEIAFANVDSVANGANTKVETSGGWSIQELFFNTLDEHFSDVHVRRAIAMVIDKDALIQALTFGYATKSNTILPTAIKYNTNDTIDALQYDLDAAKEELAQSSYPDGFDTSIIINSANDTAVQIAQVLQDSAAKIGINIEVKSEETATFRNDFLNYNFSMMINSATADFPDADSIMAFQVDPEGFSKCYWTNYNNEEAVSLLHEAQTVKEDSEREGIYEQLQQILADDVPYIPLYEPEIIVGMGSDVNGLEILPNGSVRFENVTIGE
jgi:peptide/nickel transport system substrate-binding protein